MVKGRAQAIPPMPVAKVAALQGAAVASGVLAAQLDLAETDASEAKVAALDDAGWNGKGQFFSGGKLVMEMPIGEFLWFILFDAIHHRGQLSTYIRPMGGQVPPIYGASGDSRR